MVLALSRKSAHGELSNPSILVDTPSGRVKGYKETHNQTHPMIRFIGIPYAKPPVNNLRFRKPRPIGKWDDVQGIPNDHGPGCMQDDGDYIGTYEMGFSEDCLCLNIYVPGHEIKQTKTFSVMVWIHGKDFIHGSTSEYFPHNIVAHGDVIVVTFNYRLGVFGFLNIDDQDLTKNLGLWDQIAALQWVHKNIAAFGGNPKNVTIIGHSSGAVCAHLLSLMPRNGGLFQRVIAMSGVVSRNTVVKPNNAEKVNRLLSERTNCTETTQSSIYLDCLRSVPAEKLVDAVSLQDFIPTDNITADLYVGPAIDGELITKDPYLLLYEFDSNESRFFRSLDFVAGSTDVEGSLLYRKIVDSRKTSLVSEYENNLNFSLDSEIPFHVFKDSIAPGVINSLYGNNPILTHKVVAFYHSHRGSLDQSNQAMQMYGQATIVTPTISALVAHSRNNAASKTYHYLVTLISPLPEGPPPPPWFGGCGHGDELYLLFRLMATPINLQMRDFHHDLSRKVVRYWTNFAKTGYVGSLRTISFTVARNIFLHLNLKDV